MRAMSSSAVWTFDDFQPGLVLGRPAIALDALRLAHWTAIYGSSSATPDRLPSGLLVAAMMESYLRAVQPRPPGNIHARQGLKFSGTAKPGEELRAEVACIGKELSRERRWVTFGVTLRCGIQNVLSGEIQTIWAR
ncbi:acyl dehydratase [Roseiarcus fermentans]|uniref:Acyl dehydratase n=1 Tax=Roseiarcus fermentans TaxID=1473586 RepID=A0A366F7E5_9HYPH|nr:MaoC family dehydratase [Roseiarcus fermentans]RBP09880.1 acyl dehydratase [Roseiarcus fermentans]